MAFSINFSVLLSVSMDPSKSTDQLCIGGKDRTIERRALVRLLVRAGADDVAIARKLLAANYLPATWTLDKQVKFLHRDITAVRREDTTRFTVVYQEASTALYEYIARQEYLYAKAVENGSYELAAKLSKDIARGHGVVTEEPVRVETDILQQFGDAFALAEKKMLEHQPKRLPAPRSAEVAEIVSLGQQNGSTTRD